MKGSVRAKEIAARIEQNCIAHMRMQIIAYFVTTYMPIDIIRKDKKLLSQYLEMASHHVNKCIYRVGAKNNLPRVIIIV